MCIFFWQNPNFVWFGPFWVLKSLWNRFQSIFLILELNLKKNPIGKYFFIMEKNDFENFDFQKKSKSLIFSIEKSIFWSKHFTWKNQFFYWKNENFELFLKSKIFKIIFLHDEKIFFDGIFFKFNSWPRRIVLKRFQSDSNSLKQKKVKEKKWLTEIRWYLVIIQSP